MNAGHEAARGLTDIENLLYRHVHMRRARQRVTDFTAREPGLTEEQKAGIEHWYLEEQNHIALLVSEHIADRMDAMHAGNTAGFVRPKRQLRGSCLAQVLIAAVMVAYGAAVVTGHA